MEYYALSETCASGDNYEPVETKNVANYEAVEAVSGKLGNYEPVGESHGNYEAVGESHGNYEAVGESLSSGNYEAVAESLSSGNYEAVAESRGNYEPVGESHGNYEAVGESYGNYEAVGESLSSGNYEAVADSLTGGCVAGGNYAGSYEDVAQPKAVVSKAPVKKAVVVQEVKAVPARDYHSEYISLLCGEQTLESALATCALMDAFTKEATDVAVRIMKEKDLPDFARTIKPIDVGGVAGGVKYIVGRIFYKVAVDESGN
jgi:hypothetical protein